LPFEPGVFCFSDLTMNHFDFPAEFLRLYDQSVALYAAGKRDAASYFNAAEKAWLTANGITAQHLYDYAEDHNGYHGEPGPGHALTIETMRRNYFLNAQQGKPSSTVLDAAKLPAKTDAVRGIDWLPRLIPKTRAKLRGELPATLMFCCGGDRAFFRQHNILPAEFLGLVWRHENDDAAIVDWVVRRSGGK
jgi:hypothetical protein